ncbi:MAG: DUF5134 domain-containing protein [Leucobacter sp.]
MLTAPWNLILTVVFAFTGVYCLVRLIAHRPPAGAPRGPVLESLAIHLMHLVMSAGMIAMCWFMMIPAALNWAQIVVFTVLALALLPGLWKAPLLARRVDLAGHIWLAAAMVWMIAAMPLLMADMGGGEHGGGHGEAADGAMMMAMSTPLWVDVLNGVFVAGSAAIALWWAYRAATIRGERLHALCHCLMAAGMAAMLLLMNG